MKKLLLILLFSFSNFVAAQLQKFSKYGFQLQCGCKLYDSKDFKARSQETVDVFASLVCAADNKIIYNLNVYRDNSGSAERFNKNYIQNLRENNITYSVSSVSGIKSVEYTFLQGNLPTKAVVFYVNGKSYLLQAATKENLSSTFNLYRNSFKFIK